MAPIQPGISEVLVRHMLERKDTSIGRASKPPSARCLKTEKVGGGCRLPTGASTGSYANEDAGFDQPSLIGSSRAL